MITVAFFALLVGMLAGIYLGQARERRSREAAQALRILEARRVAEAAEAMARHRACTLEQASAAIEHALRTPLWPR